MSTASHPWKQHLLKQAETMEKLRGVKRLAAPSAIKLEESVVLGFYAIRRLIGGSLLPESLVRRPIPMTAFPARRASGAIRLGDEEVKELYDFAAGRAVSHDLIFLCHQVLHNCTFTPQFDAGHAVMGILVTSDHQRKVAVYGIALDTAVSLFRRIGEG